MLRDKNIREVNSDVPIILDNHIGLTHKALLLVNCIEIELVN